MQVIKFYRLTDGSTQKGRQIGHLAVCVQACKAHTNTQVHSLLYNHLQAVRMYTHIILHMQCMHHWNCAFK